MATRKSTTKAKTKTARTKPANARSARSTAKVSQAAAVSKSKRPAQVVNILQLRRIHSLGTLIYAALAVAAGVLMNSTTYELTTGYLTKDELVSRVSTVFAPAARVLYDVEIRWIVVTLLILSAIPLLLYVTRLERSYAERLKGRVLGWRWIDLAITGALMMETIALLSGVHNIMTLKLIGGMIALAAALSWISERQNENAAQPVWSAYVTSLFACILPWLVILAYAGGTLLYGMVRTPWYVYALYASAAIGFGLLTTNLYNQHRRLGSWKDYMAVERNYQIINFLNKVAFAVILIVGLKR